MKSPTQNEMILVDMMMGNRISPIDALRDYGCFRLAARICELRDQGYAIQSGTVHTEGKYGPVHFSEYWIDREDRNYD